MGGAFSLVTAQENARGHQKDAALPQLQRFA
jgi:hypothetical protein